MSSWLWLSGCTISAVDQTDDRRPTNTCSVESDCGSDENCNDGLCQPSNGALEALLLEVTPPSDSEAPHLSFVSHLEAVPTSGGELKIPPVQAASVTGNLHLPKGSCYPGLPQDGAVPLPPANDLSLPASVTLFPRERLLGLPQQLYVTASDFRKDGTYKFDMVVPPGDYDVYLVPSRGQEGCAVPPQLFRGQTISGQTTLDYPVSNSSTLDLRIRWPKGAHTLDGWVADIIEPLGGRPISTEVELEPPVDQAEGSLDVTYRLPLVYSTVSELKPSIDPIEFAADLVRLRPPPGDPTPTIFLDRTALGLLSASMPTVTGFTRYPAPVRVEGQLARADDGSALAGSVTVVSTDIAGVDDGIFASFQATVQVSEEDEGIFVIDMPPGTYRVHAVPGTGVDGTVPGEGSLSALEARWEIAAGSGFQAGKLLELAATSVVTGQSKFEGAEVRVAASPQKVLPFQEAFGIAPFVPRGRNGLVESGHFSVSVDPGRFDVSLRAPESLGFGWFVKPGVEVADAPQDLGDVELKAPSALRGTTTGLFADKDADTREPVLVSRIVGSCSVRAYAYLDRDLAYTRDAAAAVSVVQVAETRSDDRGAFRLLVPSSLAASK
jgi:hypothetical protein